MKKNFLGYKFKKALLASIVLGCLMGVFNVFSTTSQGQGFWVCPVPRVGIGGNECVSSGCRNASQDPSQPPIFVCDYEGLSCPPLQECEPSY